MPKAGKSRAIDLSEPQDLTLGLIDRLTCPPDKIQVFLRDKKAPGLAVRCTKNGSKSYVFESSVNGQNFRLTIGDVRVWPLDSPKRANQEENQNARDEARRLKIAVSSGIDPRDPQRRRVKSAPRTGRVTGLEAWAEYIEEGKRTGFTKRGPWGELHYRDHLYAAAKGNEEKKRGQGKTKPGALYSLLAKPLAQINQASITKTIEQENKTRPTRTANAFRLLAGFINWCSRHPHYKALVKPVDHASPDVRRIVKGIAPKNDSLQREQLRVFFGELKKLNNRFAATYILAILLTGARPGEILKLRWRDIDFNWASIKLGDKVEGTRVIPLTPYLATQLKLLAGAGEFVFPHDVSDSKPMMKPHLLLGNLCKAAGISPVTFHGLRRSFKNMTEWLEIPAGVVAQIMGHKPSATAERHYTNRPIDLLRVHHNKIESWIVEQAQTPEQTGAANNKSNTSLEALVRT